VSKGGKRVDVLGPDIASYRPEEISCTAWIKINKVGWGGKVEEGGRGALASGQDSLRERVRSGCP